MERGIGRHWRGAIPGVEVALKPQVALLMSWHLLDWLRNDRKTLVRWGGATAILWRMPLLWRPIWISDWMKATPPLELISPSNAPGIFSLLQVTMVIWPLLAIITVGIFV